MLHQQLCWEPISQQPPHIHMSVVVVVHAGRRTGPHQQEAVPKADGKMAHQLPKLAASSSIPGARSCFWTLARCVWATVGGMLHGATQQLRVSGMTPLCVCLCSATLVPVAAASVAWFIPRGTRRMRSCTRHTTKAQCRGSSSRWVAATEPRPPPAVVACAHVKQG